MFLQSLLSSQLSEQVCNIVKLVIAQVNILLALVNDVLDLKLIEENQFEPNLQIFNLKETFEFLKNMFKGLSNV
jgi:signal transduction histidine kinase